MHVALAEGNDFDILAAVDSQSPLNPDAVFDSPHALPAPAFLNTVPLSTPRERNVRTTVRTSKHERKPIGRRGT